MTSMSYTISLKPDDAMRATVALLSDGWKMVSATRGLELWWISFRKDAP